MSYDREHVTAAIADLAGSVRWQRRWDGPFDDDVEQRLRQIAHALKLAVSSASKAGMRVVAAGAADPGTVDIASGGAVRAVNMPGWQNVPVVQRLRKATGLPVVMQRGDGWQALGEVAFGAGRGVRHALFVTLLEGIGGGIVRTANCS